MSGSTSEYAYDLPAELIASHPVPQRDGARMLVVDRETGALEHSHFTEFPRYLREGDLVVLNDTRVLHARIFSNDRKVELLFLRESPEGHCHWICLGKPGKRLRLGARIEIASARGEVISIGEDGERTIAFDSKVDLEQHGELPIPPYMNRPAEADDEARYQTVFARDPGSVAAPTAGLHFTPELLARIPHAFLTLHVGVGTFRPVTAERIEDHRMHSEQYVIPQETADRINAARRVIAVGTTVTRVLESQPPGPIRACSGSTDIFIRPPHTFRHVHALLTNFHLPKSTLLMLVSAMAGRERILEAYRVAVRERYRFFSYGDCMWIAPGNG